MKRQHQVPQPQQKTKAFQLRWNEALGSEECPYAYRWVLIFFGYSIRIHHFLRSDDKRHLHDHAWWFITLVIKGSYTDVSAGNDANTVVRDTLNPFTLRYRKAQHRHYVDVPVGGCLTILITGKPLRKWGFWVNGVMKRPLKYFHKFGHPPCDDQ